MTGLVFLIALPAVLILAATWAWRYQLQALELIRGRRHADDLPPVRLRDVTVTAADRVELVLEHPSLEMFERVAVAIDVPSSALASLCTWRASRAPLVLLIPPGSNIVRLRDLDHHHALTLRRVA